MEIGGLMADTFRIFLGNPDILALVLTFTVTISLTFTALQVYKNTK